jgi:hypothetical protein
VLNPRTGTLARFVQAIFSLSNYSLDPESALLYISTRAGKIHIFDEDSPDKLNEVETVKTEYGVKTMGFDPKTHNLFLTTADFRPAPAPTKEDPHPERKPIPGTFRVPIYGR